jgi:amino acid transporter
MNLTMVTDLCSIGTLFAFVLVCGGVLVLQNKKDIPERKFKTPFINAKYILPFMIFIAIIILFTSFKDETKAFLQNKPTIKTTHEILLQLNDHQILTLKEENRKSQNRYEKKSLEEIYLDESGAKKLEKEIGSLGWKNIRIYQSSWSNFASKIPTWIFILFTMFITIMAIFHNLSLIPILGLLSCLYMMSEIELKNWVYFSGWLVIGLIIYFLYGRKNSKLNLLN